MSDKDMETIVTIKERIQRNKIPGYNNPEFWEGARMWQDYKEFGFPYSGGSMDQPALWHDIIRLFNSCAIQMEVK